MKIAWVILLIAALTDFLITAGTALTTAMLATGSAAMPSMAVMMMAAIGGITAAARTVQQALKITPETTQSLRGDPPPEVKKQGGDIVTTITTPAPRKK